MVLAWIRHKEPRRCLALILLMGVGVALAAAQQPPKAQASPAPRLIILPPRAVAGAQATLAVFDFRGRLLPNIAVELSGGQKVTTDVTGRALFQAPDEPGILVARISGQAISASTTVVASEDSGPQATSHAAPEGVNVVSYPHVVAMHDRFTVEGSGFRGL